jgi:hypothetical protein
MARSAGRQESCEEISEEDLALKRVGAQDFGKMG